MKEFANLNLDTINCHSLNSLLETRNKFLHHFQEHYIYPERSQSQQLMVFLKKYLACHNIQATNYDDLLANLLPYLPRDEQLYGFNNNMNLRLLILKIVFRQAGFPDDKICQLDYRHRLAAVKELRKKICPHNDWEYEVQKIWRYLILKNLELAQRKMEKISNLSKEHITSSQKPFLYALQIIYCIDIIEFIDSHKLHANCINIYNQAVETIEKTVDKLKKLNSSPSCIFFAWNAITHKSNKVVPHPLTDGQPQRMRLNLA